MRCAAFWSLTQRTCMKPGLAVRGQVLGAAHVASAVAGMTEFDQHFQTFISRTAWGAVWTRPGLDQRTRCQLKLALMATLHRETEFRTREGASRSTGAIEVRRGSAYPACRLCQHSRGQLDRAGGKGNIAGHAARERGMTIGEPDFRPFRRYRSGMQPSNDSPAYGSRHKRHPRLPPVRLEHTLAEIAGPVFSPARLAPTTDLSVTDGKAALGERIVQGRIADEDGRPVPHTMIQIQQGNAAGRYAHDRDQHDAPLDPNLRGVGRVLTDADGTYRLVTIKPGAYPWRNDANTWRPNHIHFSFFGPAFASRLITQMYFPGDPLLPLDPILNAIPDAEARNRLVAPFGLDITQPEWALGYRFDVVLRGRPATAMEA